MFAKQHTQLDVEHIFLALLQQRNSPAGADHHPAGWRCANHDPPAGERPEQLCRASRQQPGQRHRLYHPARQPCVCRARLKRPTASTTTSSPPSTSCLPSLPSVAARRAAFLMEADIDQEKIYAVPARDPRRPPCHRPNPEEHYEALERFSVDLTKAGPRRPA